MPRAIQEQITLDKKGGIAQIRVKVVDTSHEALMVIRAIPSKDPRPLIKKRHKEGADPLEEFKKKASYLLAKRALELAQYYIGRREDGGRYDIGFTGRAARGLEVSHHPLKGKDGWYYEIYTKPEAMKSDHAIRYGLPPNSSESAHVSWPERVAWVAHRELRWKNEDGAPPRKFASREEEDRAVAHRVWNSIKTKGTSEWYASDEAGLPNDKKRFFNYPQIIQEKERPMFDGLMRRIAEGNHDAIAGGIDGFVLGSLSTAFGMGNERWGSGTSDRTTHREYGERPGFKQK